MRKKGMRKKSMRNAASNCTGTQRKVGKRR